MSMKFAKIFILFAFLAVPANAVECLQSQKIYDTLNGKKTVCDPVETAQKIRARKEKALEDIEVFNATLGRPLWSEAEIDKTLKEHPNAFPSRVQPVYIINW